MYYSSKLIHVNIRTCWSAVQTLKGLDQTGSSVSGQFMGGPKGCTFANSNKSREERGDFGDWASRRTKGEQGWASLLNRLRARWSVLKVIRAELTSSSGAEAHS